MSDVVVMHIVIIIVVYHFPILQKLDQSLKLNHYSYCPIASFCSKPVTFIT